jgi:tetratricopeptide (TPR) repeat protein
MLALMAGLCHAQELSPGTEMQVEIAAGSTQAFALSLPEGTAADIELTQRAGFVDVELRGRDDVLKLRTESGVLGRMQATLLAAKSERWLVTLVPRQGRGAGTVGIRVSTVRQASGTDELKASAFEHYVEAEALRFANFRETAVTARPPDITARTREDYATAESQYAATEDGCGLRRARIGLSRMQVALEQYPQARATAEAALTATCDGDFAEQAQALKTLGMAAAYEGDFNASAVAAEGSLHLYEKTGDVRYQGIVLGNLSNVYMQLGETEQALAAAHGALKAAEDTADGQGIVFSRKSIADIHLARGELASALQEYRATLATLAVTPYPMVEGETWNELGIVYHRMADYPESLKAFGTAESVWKKMGSRAEEADTLINEAQTLLELGNLRSAVRELQIALVIVRADGLKSPETRALRGLGVASMAEGKLVQARRYFSQSLELARTTGELTAQSYALRAIGEVDSRQGAFKAARRNDEAALRLAREAADRDGEAATLAELARVVTRHGDLIEARGMIDQALAIIETQRGQIDDPSLRTSYFASMRAYPDTQIDLLMRLDARYPGGHYALAALVAAERARARSLQDMFAEKSIRVAHGLSPELADSLHLAEERLRTAAFQLSRASSQPTADRRALTNAFDAASHALDEVRGRVRSANPRYADLIQPGVPRIEEMQRTLLDDDAAVLEYWLGSRESYVWILTRTSFRAVRLPPRSQIETAGRELEELLRAPPGAGEDQGVEHAQGSEQVQGFDAMVAADKRREVSIHDAEAKLATMVLEPSVLRGLPQKVAIVADGCLHGLPFGILPTADGHRFGVTHDVSYLPSITTLQWLRRSGRVGTRSATLAVFAAPVGDASMAALPYSRSEADAIAALVPPERVWLALGPAASRANALAADWKRYTIAHFATHAVVDVNRPEISGIVLSSQDDQGHVQDGTLRMNDIYDLNMPVDLVVLSGCDTAAGRNVDAEGVFSLSRAFFYAGAPRVVASLWPVEDRATAAFMPEFYRALLVEHMSPASALRVAQQRLARDSRWASPYYWAGFVVQGDWN